MGLVPTDRHGGDGADVEAVDVGAIHQFGEKLGVLGDGGDDEGVADLREDFFLRRFDDRGKGAEELAIE